MRIRPTEMLAIGLIILSGILLYFLKLSSVGITDPGEAYYAEAGREMIESGDYIVPHLNYQIYFSKPILTFWMIAFAYKVFGVSEFGARIIFAVLILLLLVGTYWLASRLKNWRCGLMASLITATAPLFLAVAKLSPIDVAFTCFWDLGMFALVATLCLNSAFWPFVYIMLALAALTKGPVALVLAGLSFFIFLLCERPPIHVIGQRFRKLKLPFGVLLFALITLPWYFAVGKATDGLFPKVFFLYENFARFAGRTNLSHTNWYHYLIVSLYGFFPWIVFLIPSFGPAFRRPQHLDSLASDLTSSQAQHSSLIFIACLVGTIFLFFSCSRTQLDTYLLPALAPMAVLVANYFESKLEDSKSSLVVGNQVSLRPLFFASSIFLVIGCLVLIGPVIAANRINESDIRYGVIAAALCMAAGYIAQHWFYRKQKYGAMFTAIFAGTILSATIAGQTAFTLLDQEGQRDLRLLCDRIRETNEQVAIFRTFKPSIMFYIKRPVDSFFHTSQLLPLDAKDLSSENKLLIIAHDKTIGELQAPAGSHLKLLERRGGWSVWQASHLKLEKVQTLKDIFANNEAFEKAVKGESDWGPLTVPYGGGDPDWQRQKRN